MARKKKHEEHVNHERWLVSYADFITLLFATFTALFAMSSADMVKLKTAAESIKKAFASGSSSLFEPPSKNAAAGGGSSSMTIGLDPLSPFRPKPAKASSPERDKPKEEKKDKGDVKGEMKDLFHGSSLQPGNLKGDGGGVKPSPTPTPTPTPAPTLKLGTEGGNSEELAAEIKELMQTIGLKDAVAVREEKRGTVISLGEAAFFALGEVDVLPTCIGQLDKIVNALRNKAFEIRVEGHTDNTPVRSSGRYRDNLDLSTLRASRIVNFMIKEYHMDPTALSASGYGDTRPIADNATKEGQQKNRRVDIVILNERGKSEEPH